MRATIVMSMLSVLGACTSDGTEKGRVEVVPDRDGLDATAEVSDDTAPTADSETPDSEIPDSETPDSETPDSETPDSVPPDSETPDSETPDSVNPDVDDRDLAPEVLDEVVATTCGDGVRAGLEACDDGDDCDGDGCAACAFEPALAVVELELEEAVGWDLDDADGDGDPTTGIDNRLASSSLIRLALGVAVGQPVARGDLLLLAILGDVDALDGDPEVTLALVSGQSDCPPAAPPPWLVRADPPATVRRDPDGFDDQCVARTMVDDDDDPANGILPAPPRLRFWSDGIALSLGGLGTLHITRSRTEGALVIAAGAGGASGRLVGLDDGAIGGIVPAKALAAIDVSGLTPLCPTALHAALGLAGHLDQDAEGDGGKDFILWTTSAGVPCVTAPVTIVGCCDEGDCVEGRIDGPDCVSDPRIGDGYSTGFRVRANAVRVVGPATDACAP